MEMCLQGKEHGDSPLPPRVPAASLLACCETNPGHCFHFDFFFIKGKITCGFLLVNANRD